MITLGVNIGKLLQRIGATHANLYKTSYNKRTSPNHGLSASWFEKARTYGRGPKYIKIGNGKVLYRRDEVERWLMAQEQAPEGAGRD